MARTYDITSMEVLPKLNDYEQVVVRLNFTYGDALASLEGSCALPTPRDQFLPLDQISKDLALQWLLANCSNTTEEFDLQLDNEIKQKNNEAFVYTWSDQS